MFCWSFGEQMGQNSEALTNSSSSNFLQWDIAAAGTRIPVDIYSKRMRTESAYPHERLLIADASKHFKGGRQGQLGLVGTDIRKQALQ